VLSSAPPFPSRGFVAQGLPKKVAVVRNTMALYPEIVCDVIQVCLPLKEMTSRLVLGNL
jgi:hypothetical protein